MVDTKHTTDLPLPPQPQVKQQPSRDTAAQCCEDQSVIVTKKVFGYGRERGRRREVTWSAAAMEHISLLSRPWI